MTAENYLPNWDIILSMKKTILLITFFSVFVLAKLPIIVSIVPEKAFVEAIGGDYVSVDVMVQPGSSPHTYEPKPTQMKKIVFAKLYLSIGVEFEKVWLKKFQDLNNKLTIVDISKGIKRRPMEEKNSNKAKTLDPHIWITPTNVKIIAKNILKALIASDSEHKKEYLKNYKKFIKQINSTNKKIKKILKHSKGSVFMVFHPSWGYFARKYGLKQLPIQIAGKSPKPRDLIALIKQARKAKVKAIFTQPETPDTMVKVLADELKVPVVRISPMAPNWSDNLLKLSRTIAGKKEDE